MKRSLFLLLIATNVSAQPAPTSTIARWLKAGQDKGLSVRQAFDGKERINAREVLYLKSLYTADIGLKFLEWDPLKNSTTATFPIGPSIERHRTNTPKKSNTLSAKLNMDLAVGQLRGFSRMERQHRILPASRNTTTANTTSPSRSSAIRTIPPESPKARSG